MESGGAGIMADRRGRTASPPGRRAGDIPVRALAAGLLRRKVAIGLGLGVGLRLIQYARGRPYWMDEASLVANIRDRTPAGMFGPLGMTQLAPPGFLVAEWGAIRALGDHPHAFRLVPLLGGVASLFLILAASRRLLAPGAAWMAVALLAISGDPIYFSSEAKQYSTDLASALACLLLGLTAGSRPLTAARAAGLAAAGSAIVWFSHPSIFALAAVGVVGLAQSLGARDGRSSGLWLVVGLAWVGSFAGVHAVAMEQLGHSRDMWAFWGFAFPPIPPRSAWDATWIPRRLLLLFVDPLNFDSPFGPRLSMLPAVGLALLGSARIARADPGRLALLALPAAFALLASCLRLYPFHGRLVLFLAPSLLLAIAAGLDRVREARGRGWLYAGLAAMVLGFPALTALYRVVEPPRRDFNPYGDLRPGSIDPARFPL